MICGLLLYFFFFFKQKTAYEMRISDWSSDVCSSDLAAIVITIRITNRQYFTSLSNSHDVVIEPRGNRHSVRKTLLPRRVATRRRQAGALRLDRGEHRLRPRDRKRVV